jgi:hypothetical protein
MGAGASASAVVFSSEEEALAAGKTLEEIAEAKALYDSFAPSGLRDIASWTADAVGDMVGEMGILTPAPLAAWLTAGNKIDYTTYPPSQPEREAFRTVVEGMGYSEEEALGFERGMVRILFMNHADKEIILGRQAVPADNCLDAWEEQAMMDPEELYAEYQPAGLRHFPSWTADSAEELAPVLGIQDPKPLAAWLATAGNAIEYTAYPPSQPQREAFRTVVEGMGYSAAEALGFEQSLVRILCMNAQDKEMILGRTVEQAENCKDCWQECAEPEPEAAGAGPGPPPEDEAAAAADADAAGAAGVASSQGEGAGAGESEPEPAAASAPV